MLKPLLITYEYPLDIGGVGKYLEGEVKTSTAPVAVIKAQDLIWRFWPRWLSLLWCAHSLSFIKERDGVRLWISHILPMGYIALVWKCFYKIPYRVYLHGLDLVRPRKSIWKSFWVRRILLNANEIICNSNATAQLLKNYGIEVSRARVQYPRIEKIDINKYKSIGEKLRQKYNISDKPILLTISRLVKRKGIDLVIRALPEVWKEIPDLVYVVVGDGEERNNLRVIAPARRLPADEAGSGGSECTHERGNPAMRSYKHGIAASPSFAPSTELWRAPRNDTIIFIGSVSDEEKYGWLAACDCFILTPIDDPNDFEGYGIVYKEAQMFNKPVIGSRVGGVPEAVGNEGVLVEPGNIPQITEAIIRIMDVISN